LREGSISKELLKIKIKKPREEVTREKALKREQVWKRGLVGGEKGCSTFMLNLERKKGQDRGGNTEKKVQSTYKEIEAGTMGKNLITCVGGQKSLGTS